MSAEELESRMSDDLVAVLRECKAGNLAIVDGQMIEPGADEVPLVLMLDREMYNQLFAHAINNGMDPGEMVINQIQDMIDNHIPEDDDFEKMSSEFDGSLGITEEPPEEDASDPLGLWADSDEPPPTDDSSGFIGWGAGTLSEDRNSSVENREKIARIVHRKPFEKFKNALTKVHGSCESGVSLLLDFSVPGDISIHFEYPEDEYSMHESATGGLDIAMEEIAKKLTNWQHVWFSPKLEAETEVKAKLEAKILEFDKTVGKYVVQIGEDIKIHVPPEDIHQF